MTTTQYAPATRTVALTGDEHLDLVVACGVAADRLHALAAECAAAGDKMNADVFSAREAKYRALRERVLTADYV